MLLQASGAGGFIGTTSSHPLILRTGDQDRVVVKTDGDVHVGQGATSIAASRVNAVFATTEVEAGIAIAQNSGVNVLVQASGAGGFIGTTSNHPLVLRTNDQDRVVVRTNGDVQVGPGSTTIAASRVNAVFATTEPDAGIAIAQNSGVNVLVQASGAGALHRHDVESPARVSHQQSGSGDHRHLRQPARHRRRDPDQRRLR